MCFEDILILLIYLTKNILELAKNDFCLVWPRYFQSKLDMSVFMNRNINMN